MNEFDRFVHLSVPARKYSGRPRRERNENIPNIRIGTGLEEMDGRMEEFEDNTAQKKKRV